MDKKNPLKRDSYDGNFSNDGDYSTNLLNYSKPRDYWLSISLWETIFPGIEDLPDQPLDEQLTSILFYISRIAWFFFCLFLIALITYSLLIWMVSLL